MTLKIAVCLKQVPDTENVKFDWKKGTLIRKNYRGMINPDDLHALEMALQLKDEYQAEITVITMGPPQAENILYESYAYGVDHAVLITDPSFAGSDTLITSKVLFQTINLLGKFDIIITGFQTTDGSTGQVSYQLAEYLKVPHLTQFNQVKIVDSKIMLKRLYGHELQHIEVKMPVLLALKRNSNRVRYPKLQKISKAFEKEIRKVTLEDLSGNAEDYGQLASPTITLNGEALNHNRKCEVVEGPIDEKVEMLVQKLKKYGIIRM